MSQHPKPRIKSQSAALQNPVLNVDVSQLIFSPTGDIKPALTIREVATKLRLQPKSVRDLIKKGKLHGYRANGMPLHSKSRSPIRVNYFDLVQFMFRHHSPEESAPTPKPSSARSLKTRGAARSKARQRKRRVSKGAKA